MPAPSSATSTTTWPLSWRARRVRTPSAGLPAALRASGASMPWSTELRTRWVSGSLTASSRVLSSSVSRPSISRRTVLPQLHAEVADDARQLRPDVVDRLHARLHDALLQLAGDEVEPLRGADQVGVGLPGDVLHDLVAGEHQLADQQHQLVEQVDVHADGAVGDRAAGLAVAGGGRRGRPRRRPSGVGGRLLDGALGHDGGCSLGRVRRRGPGGAPRPAPRSRARLRAQPGVGGLAGGGLAARRSSRRAVLRPAAFLRPPAWRRPSSPEPSWPGSRPGARGRGRRRGGGRPRGRPPWRR